MVNMCSCDLLFRYFFWTIFKCPHSLSNYSWFPKEPFSHVLWIQTFVSVNVVLGKPSNCIILQFILKGLYVLLTRMDFYRTKIFFCGIALRTLRVESSVRSEDCLCDNSPKTQMHPLYLFFQFSVSLMHTSSLSVRRFLSHLSLHVCQLFRPREERVSITRRQFEAAARTNYSIFALPFRYQEIHTWGLLLLLMLCLFPVDVTNVC